MLTLGLVAAACTFDGTGLQSAGAPTVGEGSSTGTTAIAPTTTDGPETSTTTIDPTTDPTTSSTTTPVAETEPELSSSSSGEPPPPPPGCGDGELDDGEACDDGNLEDSDDCTSQCQVATCGDGFVKAGAEACDDGNTESDDACVACVAAACGDGFVHEGVEACDDGNTSDDDACTSLCTLAGCDDGLKNGDESDVDCGGPCPGCADGEACADMDDCAEGGCFDGVCDVIASCAALKQAHPGVASGTYVIDPDEGGAGEPFAVYCEQGVEGGGWTLVLKADGSKQTFAYGAQLWTNDATYNDDPDLSRDETKLQSWNSVPANEVLVAMEAPLQGNGELDLEYLKLPAGAASARALFMDSAYKPTSAGESAWRALVPGSSLQDHCNREGFNVVGDTDPEMYGRIRIGFLANNEQDCSSPNSYVGVGAGSTGPNCAANSDNTTGNRAAGNCQADNGSKDIDGFAAVFVR